MTRLLSTPLRLPRLRSYVPGPSDPRIFWFNSERGDIVREVSRRITARHAMSDEELERVLSEAAYHETRRLEGARGTDPKQLSRWRTLVRRVGRMSTDSKVEVLRKISASMARDICGNFDPRVYEFASHVLPKVLAGVIKPSTVPRRIFDPTFGQLNDLVATDGALEHVRGL